MSMNDRDSWTETCYGVTVTVGVLGRLRISPACDEIFDAVCALLGVTYSHTRFTEAGDCGHTVVGFLTNGIRDSDDWLERCQVLRDAMRLQRMLDGNE